MMKNLIGRKHRVTGGGLPKPDSDDKSS